MIRDLGKSIIKELNYNKFAGFQVSILLKMNLLHRYFYKDFVYCFGALISWQLILMATSTIIIFPVSYDYASTIYFDKLYSLPFHWFVLCVIDFIEIEPRFKKHSSDTLFNLNALTWKRLGWGGRGGQFEVLFYVTFHIIMSNIFA